MLFARLNEMIGDNTFHLTIRKDGEKMMVMFVPKTGHDNANSTLVPLSIIATPEELDEQFVAIVADGMQKLNGVITNLDEFKKITNQIEKKAASDKDAKANPKGKTTAKKEEPKADLISQLENQEPSKEEEPKKEPAKAAAPKVAKPAPEIATPEPLDDEPEDLPGGNDEFGNDDW